MTNRYVALPFSSLSLSCLFFARNEGIYNSCRFQEKTKWSLKRLGTSHNRVSVCVLLLFSLFGGAHTWVWAQAREHVSRVSSQLLRDSHWGAAV